MTHFLKLKYFFCLIPLLTCSMLLANGSSLKEFENSTLFTAYIKDLHTGEDIPAFETQFFPSHVVRIDPSKQNSHFPLVFKNHKSFKTSDHLALIFNTHAIERSDLKYLVPFTTSISFTSPEYNNKFKEKDTSKYFDIKEIERTSQSSKSTDFTKDQLREQFDRHTKEALSTSKLIGMITPLIHPIKQSTQINKLIPCCGSLKESPHILYFILWAPEPYGTQDGRQIHRLYGVYSTWSNELYENGISCIGMSKKEVDYLIRIHKTTILENFAKRATLICVEMINKSTFL